MPLNSYTTSYTDSQYESKDQGFNPGIKKLVLITLSGGLYKVILLVNIRVKSAEASIEFIS